jgi:hypothetical protein
MKNKEKAEIARARVRHCEGNARSNPEKSLDCFAPLAMTGGGFAMTK